ncbi:hypothetical protein J2Z32_001332 [Paenibacillus turicensis]|uniref:HTH cro/C1-type domain-containing protein n=1 Tax=Paenibacillus turicensis TaxID=160487 RepID=A0ABS4FQP2_9BACL|nr:XRE family transcriptional regulator [Paenibacillus turicensis]MBP1904709.1 hypothetical protein [Paenibacillus turicensis]
MLKERIEFLCKKKNITRKQLVEGLVTGTHFANILADRYPLQSDLGAAVAHRLGVKPSYITNASKQDQEVIKQAEYVFMEFSKPFKEQTEHNIILFDDHHDALVVELTVALMKAVYYQQVRDQVAYQYIHEHYLDFYLHKYIYKNENRLPSPLNKALLFYKIYKHREQNEYGELLRCASKLVPQLVVGSDVWYMIRSLQLEGSVHTTQHEQAYHIFEQLLQHNDEYNREDRLSSLYIAHSGNCFATGMYGDALMALTKAEHHLHNAKEREELQSIIFNNRIVMLTMLGQNEQALAEIDDYEAWLASRSAVIQQAMKSTLLIYRGELAYIEKNWGELGAVLHRLNGETFNLEQAMAKIFYCSQFALSQGDSDSFLKYSLECLPYFEQSGQRLRLEQLYELLAIVSEENRKYKDAAFYYRKLLGLVRTSEAR